MSAGAVWGKVVLDNPAKYHCGPNDPVTGHVELLYRTTVRSQDANDRSPSLFGPLKLFVTFYGRAKSKIRKSNGQSSTTYRGRAPLFSQQIKIHDGPWTCEPGQSTRFPFSLNFPATTQPMNGQGDFRQDRRFHEEAGGPLPPTFSTKFRGFSKSTEAFVEYRLSASMSMPGIDIDIRGLDSDHYIPVVLYEQPRLPISQAAPPQTQQFKQTNLIQNQYLLPEEERPTGFRQKTKFLFSSEHYPIYMYDIITTAPAEVYLGQPLVFEISIRPNLETTTAPLHPKLGILWLRARFLACTQVRCEHSLFSTPESDTNDALPRLSAEVIDQSVPFSKANDYTKVCRTHTGLMGVCSPFTTYNISQQYRLNVEFRIAGAGTEQTFERNMPVMVHPPLDDGSAMLSAGAGAPAYAAAASSSSAAPLQPPSAASSSTSPSIKDLPKPPTPPKSNALPQYERPPEYDEVSEMTTQDDEPEGSGSGKGKNAAT